MAVAYYIVSLESVDSERGRELVSLQEQAKSKLRLKFLAPSGFSYLRLIVAFGRDLSRANVYLSSRKALFTDTVILNIEWRI